MACYVSRRGEGSRRARLRGRPRRKRIVRDCLGQHEEDLLSDVLSSVYFLVKGGYTCNDRVLRSLWLILYEYFVSWAVAHSL